MELRRLTFDDIPACADLSESRSWPRDENKWKLLLTHGEGWGLFDDEGLVGTTIATHYPEQTAVSMVLVAERRARQGHARRLVSHVLDTGVSTLYATKMGQPLYEQLGFRAVGFTDIHAGVYTGPISNTSHIAGPSDLDDLVALDTKVSGVTRPFLWETLLAVGSVHVSSHGVAGAWRIRPDTLVIGPIIADSPADACALIADAAAGNGRVRLDVHDPEVIAFVREHGLESYGECAVMIRNADRLPGDRSRFRAPFLQALG
ncbi:GNAT family N-acetyltransferase [Lentzea sp. NPDC051838]|uniref:GNAT family N-acetyltransferase n=1 Tax=Lentzea sp. NPDC051838 TaxID=3154849 RepID=UPI0034365B5D